ncbi:MAG: hypothetical protein IJ622_09520 [Bacteroidales bacterium]|nr:hypothetical protein [Bacteroidales bacterium]
MKKLIAITAALMMATAPAMAQVFIMDEDEWNGNRAATEDPSMPGAMILEQDSPNDQYVPVGEGLMLLTTLAGAYLLGKKKSQKDN